MIKEFTEFQSLKLGQAMAEVITPPFCTFLIGDLGVGKTTLVKNYLRAMGYKGTVPSPTFSILEVYEIFSINVIHIDLYRISDNQELKYLGLQELHNLNSIWFVEWPENGLIYLPNPDFIFHMKFQTKGRLLSLEPGSDKGKKMMQALIKSLG